MGGQRSCPSQCWSKAVVLLHCSRLLFANPMSQLQKGLSQLRVSSTSTLACPKKLGEDPRDEAGIEMDDNLRPEPGGKDVLPCSGVRTGAPWGISPRRQQQPHILSVQLPLPSTGNQQGWGDCGFTSYSFAIQLCQVPLGGGFHAQ